jgi:uncharacterized protein (DUF362 family)
MDTVALLKIQDSFVETLREAIKLIGGLTDLGSPLIMKPNICTGNDRSGCANVKVEVIEVLIKEILKERARADTEIRLVESDSGSKWADKAFQRFGYKDYVDKKRNDGANISLINLSESPLTEFKFSGAYFNNPELPEPLKGVGSIVSVALPKTHSLTMITGSLKNIFGFLPVKRQAVYHPSIHEVILDLNNMFRSELCLIDGRMGLEGVVDGNPRKLGCVILGRNPVSVDSVMARIMGFEPDKIRHIVEAERLGLGTINPKVIGNSVDECIVEFKKPSGLRSNAVLN